MLMILIVRIKSTMHSYHSANVNTDYYKCKIFQESKNDVKIVMIPRVLPLWAALFGIEFVCHRLRRTTTNSLSTPIETAGEDWKLAVDACWKDKHILHATNNVGAHFM